MKIILVDLESINTRYTSQWKSHIPNLLENVSNDINIVSGKSSSNNVTDGAFLNFAETNIYKSEQAIELMKIINKTENGKILFLDAWNPVIIMAKYMIDLLEKEIEIHSIWHAGSYDPHDFLGRKIKNKSWSLKFEEALYNASDINYFASSFHIDLFKKSIGNIDDNKTIRTGFPMEYINDYIIKKEKTDSIVFPHRLSVEKNPQILRNFLVKTPNIEGIFCQEKELTKNEYYSQLAISKVVFSANEQETLGIGTYEGMASNAIPIVPDRLSYKEMYHSDYRYNNVQEMENKINYFIKDHNKIVKSNRYIKNLKYLRESYFSSNIMIDKLKEQK